MDRDINQFLQRIAKATDAALEECLPRSEAPERNLYEAMRYSVFAGGKRLRPALFAATMIAFGQEYKPYISFAAALEMIHTYSLIHDDLPAMDNDDFRRGHPTCHKVYGDAMAILAGDALLTHAFYTMVKVSAPPERLIPAIREVADLSGCGGMVAGQAAEFATAGLRHDTELLDYINLRKTGGLFAAAVLSAAHLCGATEQQLEQLREYAYYAGKAFQIIDDVLDVNGDEQELGKPVGSDSRNDKSTYPALLGCEQSKIEACKAAEQARMCLAGLGREADLLRDFLGIFVERAK